MPGYVVRARKWRAWEPSHLKSAVINGEFLTTQAVSTGRHCNPFIADEDDDGLDRNGDRAAQPGIFFCWKV